MKLPPPRGRLSAWLVTTLTSADPAAQRHEPAPPVHALAPHQPAWHDDDLQLALWCGYELHYRGFDEGDFAEPSSDGRVMMLLSYPRRRAQ